jgi:arsenite methyltransferase
VPEPFVLLQTRFNERSYGGSIVETIRAFVPGHGGVTREEADAWAADLRARGEDGRFFFSLNQYLFVAEKG